MMHDRGATTPSGTVAWIFAKAADAERAVDRLREAGFADVRLSGRSGTTTQEHVAEADGLTAGDFAGSLEAAGFSGFEARAFTDGIASGGTLLTIAAGDRAADAQAVLRGETVAARTLGPVDVAAPPSAVVDPAPVTSNVGPAPVTGNVEPARESRVAQPVPPAEKAPSAAATTSAETSGSAHASAPTPSGDDAQTMQLREERLDVEKQRMQSEARVRKEVVTEDRTITVPVQHEELVVEREGEAPMRIPISDERRGD